MPQDPDVLFERAKKYKNSSRGFLSFLTGGKSLEDAEELFMESANLYKLQKKWKESGNAFLEVANIKLNTNEKSEAAARYADAANSFKKISPSDAVAAFENSAKIYSEIGRRSIAAKHTQQMAILCREELNDLDRSLKFFQDAAEIFYEEDAPSSGSGCLLEAGKIAADLEKYSISIKLLEQVAIGSTKNSLTKWSAKEYFLMCGICYLASGDVVGCQRAIVKYSEEDATFSQQREFVFLKNLSDALENGDTDSYTMYCKEFDSLTKLDSWKTTHLLRAKKELENESLR